MTTSCQDSGSVRTGYGALCDQLAVATASQSPKVGLQYGRQARLLLAVRTLSPYGGIVLPARSFSTNSTSPSKCSRVVSKAGHDLQYAPAPRTAPVSPWTER